MNKKEDKLNLKRVLNSFIIFWYRNYEYIDYLPNEKFSLIIYMLFITKAKP